MRKQSSILYDHMVRILNRMTVRNINNSLFPWLCRSLIFLGSVHSNPLPQSHFHFSHTWSKLTNSHISIPNAVLISSRINKHNPKGVENKIRRTLSSNELAMVFLLEWIRYNMATTDFEASLVDFCVRARRVSVRPNVNDLYDGTASAFRRGILDAHNHNRILIIMRCFMSWNHHRVRVDTRESLRPTSVFPSVFSK